MSYFEHTNRDLAAQRAAGIEETRREIGEALAALADDSSRKLDDENTDRQVILEDLITRLTALAEEFGADVTLFESLENFADVLTVRLPIEPEHSKPVLRVVTGFVSTYNKE